MKNYILISCLFVLSIVNCQLSTAAGGIEFTHDKKFQEILALAKAQNKLVFIDCFTSWCGPCKRLAATAFPDASVGEFFNANFINASFDMEKEEGPSIASKYGIRAYPTLLWIDGDGNVKHKMVGGMDAAALLEQGKKAIDPTPEILNGMRKKYEDGNRDVDFLADYLNTLDKSGEKVEPVFTEYLSKLTPANQGDKKHIQTVFNLTNDIKSPGLSYLTKNRDQYKSVVGTDAFDKKINQIAAKAEEEAPKADNKAMFEQAIELVKSNKGRDKDEEILQLSMDYYMRMGDWENYDTYTSKYIKKYGAKNAALLNDAAWNYFINIINPDKLKKATTWAFTALNMDNKYTYNLTYAYLLYKQNNYKEAERACDYAIIRAKAENVEPTSANSLKDSIAKSLAKQ